MTVSFSLEFDSRPWTTNSERRGNRWVRASLTKEWRTAFHWLCAEQRMPPLAWCHITAEPWLASRRGMQDTGACSPAVKAAIDGLVDAGLLQDDSPKFVRQLTFVAPQIGRDALVLIIEGEIA